MNNIIKKHDIKTLGDLKPHIKELGVIFKGYCSYLRQVAYRYEQDQINYLDDNDELAAFFDIDSYKNKVYRHENDIIRTIDIFLTEIKNKDIPDTSPISNFVVLANDIDECISDLNDVNRMYSYNLRPVFNYIDYEEFYYQQTRESKLEILFRNKNIENDK